MALALKVGKKGGTYYISSKGKKVYADKLPDTKEPKSLGSTDKKPKAKGDGKVHPTHAKKVEGFKAKGQATGESFEGNELFVGGKGNHFYVNKTTGNKVIITKKKAKTLGLSSEKKAATKKKKKETAPEKTASMKKKLAASKEKTAGAKKQLTKTQSKIDEAKQDLASVKDQVVQMKQGSNATANEIALGQQKVKAYEDKIAGLEGKTTTKGKGHTKEKKYAGLKTGDTSADGQTVFKGKGGNYFTVHPTKGTKQLITKKSAKDQGFSGTTKSKASSGKGAYASKSAADAHQKSFKPLSYKSNKTKIGKEAEAQWNDLSGQSQSYIKQYTGSGYESTNKGLRKPPPSPYIKERVSAMDEAFTKVKTPHDYQVYRSSSTNSGRVPPPVGGLYEDDGYSSTSFSKSSAESFEGSKKNKMFMSIDVPKGSRALYVDKNSHHSGEKELLVDRGAKIRIVGRELKGGVWHVKGILENTHNSN